MRTGGRQERGGRMNGAEIAALYGIKATALPGFINV
jgi:hypothetical protein